ncbi:MAG: DUF1579 family protein [Trueperaceae bacterium]
MTLLQTATFSQNEVNHIYDLANAGPQHELLAATVGHWQVTLRIFSNPDKPFVNSRIESSKAWVLDQHHILETLRALDEGAIENRMSLWSYNRVNGRFEHTAVDNQDTHQQRYEGQADLNQRVITLNGTYTQAVQADLIAGDGISKAMQGDSPTARRTVAGVLYSIRTVLTVRNGDYHLQEFFMRPAATEVEFKGWEFEYKRM